LVLRVSHFASKFPVPASSLLTHFVDNMAPAAAASKANKLTREEELLLQDFSRNVTTKSSALFYGNAFIVSAIPVCKFHKMLPELEL